VLQWDHDGEAQRAKKNALREFVDDEERHAACEQRSIQWPPNVDAAVDWVNRMKSSGKMSMSNLDTIGSWIGG